MALRPLPLFDKSLVENTVKGPMMIGHYHPAIGYLWTGPFRPPATCRGVKRKYLRRFQPDVGRKNNFRLAGWNPFAGRIRAKNWFRHYMIYDEVPW